MEKEEENREMAEEEMEVKETEEVEENAEVEEMEHCFKSSSQYRGFPPPAV